MITFTTRQREILKIILDANRPIGSVELAKLLHITPRQVNYSMKGIQEHLPEVAAKLGDDLTWTNVAEEVLIEKMWEKPA